jgi:peroxiredoxin
MPAFLNRKKKPSGIWPASPAHRESAVRFSDRGETVRVEGGKNRVGLILLAGLLLVLPRFLEAADKSLPFVGSVLPRFQMETPPDEADKKYLGIGKSGKFTWQQISAQVLLVEIIGVYCPQCHRQAPGFNRLFQRIQKDTRLGPKVKMLAIAAGGSATELGYVKQEFPIPFPIIRDTQYEIHKLLGEPRTPFTLLIDRKGKVLFTHLGVIEDMESFFNRIAVLVP